MIRAIKLEYDPFKLLCAIQKIEDFLLAAVTDPNWMDVVLVLHKGVSGGLCLEGCLGFICISMPSSKDE